MCETVRRASCYFTALVDIMLQHKCNEVSQTEIITFNNNPKVEATCGRKRVLPDIENIRKAASVGTCKLVSLF